MELRGSIIYKGLPIIIILNQINAILRTDTYFFKICPILSSHLHVGLPRGLFPVGLAVKILKALLPSSILAICSAHLKSSIFKQPDYIRQMVQTMNFFIVKQIGFIWYTDFPHEIVIITKIFQSYISWPWKADEMSYGLFNIVYFHWYSYNVKQQTMR